MPSANWSRKSKKPSKDTIPLYIETSHAFLKSYWDIAPEFFPKMKVFHLIRNPLEAKSEANRDTLINRWKLPFRHYWGRDNCKYFRWALTGREPIFASFDLEQLSLFQRYIIQWIEIENRAMEFLRRFDMRSSCMTLHTPRDLKDPKLIVELFHFLDLDLISDKVIFPSNQNRTPGYATVIGEEERHQCREIVKRIPASYLEIFRYEPYTNYPWNGLMRK